MSPLKGNFETAGAGLHARANRANDVGKFSVALQPGAGVLGASKRELSSCYKRKREKVARGRRVRLDGIMTVVAGQPIRLASGPDEIRCGLTTLDERVQVARKCLHYLPGHFHVGLAD